MKRLWWWLVRLFRRVFNRVARTFYEGPDPPIRLAQAVSTFAAMRPDATTRDWMDFASNHAAESYKTGYLRGVEWTQRSPENIDRAYERTAEEDRHDWSWVKLAPAEEQLREMVRNFPDIIERLSPEERLLYMDRMGQLGGFRVELIPDKGDP